jgi:hypothetical protein
LITFHHIGIIVSSLSDFEAKMLYEEKVAQVFDPIQNAHLALYKNYSDSYIELIQPIDEQSFTWNFLKKSGHYGYHHMCYEVSSAAVLKDIQQKYRLLPILEPVPAVLFNGKLVAFFYSRNKAIIEFLISTNENVSHF